MAISIIAHKIVVNTKVSQCQYKNNSIKKENGKKSPYSQLSLTIFSITNLFFVNFQNLLDDQEIVNFFIWEIFLLFFFKFFYSWFFEFYGISTLFGCLIPNPFCCPISWSSRIYWLHLCRGVKAPHYQRVSYIWLFKIWWWSSRNAGALGNAEYLFIAIAPRSTLAQSGST